MATVVESEERVEYRAFMESFKPTMRLAMDLARASIDTAGKAIAILPPEKWAGWVAYLLEVLEVEARLTGDEAEVDRVLEEVKQAIVTRLEAGEW